MGCEIVGNKMGCEIVENKKHLHCISTDKISNIESTFIETLINHMNIKYDLNGIDCDIDCITIKKLNSTSCKLLKNELKYELKFAKHISQYDNEEQYLSEINNHLDKIFLIIFICFIWCVVEKIDNILRPNYQNILDIPNKD